MKSVLLIDDKPDLRKRLDRELCRYGYRTIPAADGREALEKLAERNWDCECVVTDLNMPGMDGWELLARLRRLRNDLPLITISLHSAWQPFVRDKGAWDFWAKLEDPGKLIRGIEAVSRKAKQLRKQRKSPRLNIEGEILIPDPAAPVWGRIFNISQRGLLFEIDEGCRLPGEFPGECFFKETRIVFERLRRDWESIDDAGRLVGARIEKISTEERSLLQDFLA